MPHRPSFEMLIDWWCWCWCWSISQNQIHSWNCDFVGWNNDTTQHNTTQHHITPHHTIDNTDRMWYASFTIHSTTTVAVIPFEGVGWNCELLLPSNEMPPTTLSTLSSSAFSIIIFLYCPLLTLSVCYRLIYYTIELLCHHFWVRSYPPTLFVGLTSK